MVKIELSGGPHDGFRAECDDSFGIPKVVYTPRSVRHIQRPLLATGGMAIPYYRSLKLTRQGRLIYEFKPWLNP